MSNGYIAHGSLPGLSELVKKMGDKPVTEGKVTLTPERIAEIKREMDEWDEAVKKHTDWKVSAGQWPEWLRDSLDALVEAQQTIARLTDALVFYKERNHYMPTIEHVTGTMFSEVDVDCGARARDALGEGDSNSCTHKNIRRTGDILVLSDGCEIGIAICKDCGKEVPEKEDES
ncbi:hypothetical protein PSTEL_00525 [Paenibacillus stellifer]|uniref:Uncharacterized protein n=1 Tax=Paenibacillus stellifer TaxID=169760 RepID=A0A089MZL0_9BACL|nr:hypothetical protein [Paenibacillus stellifer]AIQ61839.1 hypothetical protein PSTEL_00525 [Paenibacillus stellifer]